MKRIRKYFFLQVFLFAFFAPEVFSQTHAKWIIVDAVTTFTQMGVANPVKTNFAEQRKFCIGHYIYWENNSLIFSSQLKKTEFYKKVISIGQLKIFKVKDDDDLTMRYPGNELITTDSKSGFVGVSFMKLLGTSRNQKTLSFYELTNNLGKAGEFCEIERNKKMGLFLYDDFVILILKKVR